MPGQEHMWHSEVVSPAVERALCDLHELSVVAHFYLAGGTGLALRLGHRRSLDLDFFIGEILDPEALIQKARQLPGFSVVAKGEGTLHVQVQGAKLSFLHPIVCADRKLGRYSWGRNASRRYQRGKRLAAWNSTYANSQAR